MRHDGVYRTLELPALIYRRYGELSLRQYLDYAIRGAVANGSVLAGCINRAEHVASPIHLRVCVFETPTNPHVCTHAYCEPCALAVGDGGARNAQVATQFSVSSASAARYCEIMDLGPSLLSQTPPLFVLDRKLTMPKVLRQLVHSRQPPTFGIHKPQAPFEAVRDDVLCVVHQLWIGIRLQHAMHWRLKVMPKMLWPSYGRQAGRGCVLL
eukprot:6030675-Prymnesium_polylepis.2